MGTSTLVVHIKLTLRTCHSPAKQIEETYHFSLTRQRVALKHNRSSRRCSAGHQGRSTHAIPSSRSVLIDLQAIDIAVCCCVVIDDVD